MIGILSEDHHLHITHRSIEECIEHILCRGVNLFRLIFPVYLFIQVFIIRLLKLRPEQSLPVIIYHHFPLRGAEGNTYGVP